MRLLALLICGVAYGQGLPKADPAKEGFSGERLQRITAELRQWVDKREFAGITAAVARNGKVVYFETFGYQDLEAGKALDSETIFRIFSMTKPIVSAAVMMLYEEGRFLLDDPVSKYIAGFEKVKVLTTEDGDGGHVVDLETEVTVKHLLTHTSGLSNGKAYRAQGVFSRDITLEEMAGRVVKVPLAHQPGKAWRYAESINVLGRLIEVWSGKTLDVFLAERVFQPLGMRDTGFSVPKEKLGRLSQSYALDKEGKLVAGAGFDASVKPKFLSGSGGLYSTAGDYLRFSQMLLNGGELDGKRLLGPRTVALMMRNHVPEGVLPVNGPNGRKGYGFGLGGAVLMNVAASDHLASEGEFNWGGAAGTYFWVDRKERVVGLMMLQRPPFVPQPGKKFKAMVYQAVVDADIR
jgi:CubicO group peptidase (beta-lactamase class C family)